MPAGKSDAWEKQDEVLSKLRGRRDEDLEAERMEELRRGLAETHEKRDPKDQRKTGRPRLPGNSG